MFTALMRNWEGNSKRDLRDRLARREDLITRLQDEIRSQRRVIAMHEKQADNDRLVINQLVRQVEDTTDLLDHVTADAAQRFAWIIDHHSDVDGRCTRCNCKAPCRTVRTADGWGDVV